MWTILGDVRIVRIDIKPSNPCDQVSVFVGFHAPKLIVETVAGGLHNAFWARVINSTVDGLIHRQGVLALVECGCLLVSKDLLDRLRGSLGKALDGTTNMRCVNKQRSRYRHTRSDNVVGISCAAIMNYWRIGYSP